MLWKLIKSFYKSYFFINSKDLWCNHFPRIDLQILIMNILGLRSPWKESRLKNFLLKMRIRKPVNQQNQSNYRKELRLSRWKEKRNPSKFQKSTKNLQALKFLKNPRLVVRREAPPRCSEVSPQGSVGGWKRNWMSRSLEQMTKEQCLQFLKHQLSFIEIGDH